MCKTSHSWDLPISQEKIRKIQQTRLGYRQKIHAKITRNHLLQNCFRLEFYQIWKIHIPNCIVIRITLYSKVWYMRCHVFLFSTHVLLVHSNALQTSTCTEDQLYHQRLRFPVALPHLRRITGALRLAGCAAARVAEAVPKCGRDSYLKNMFASNTSKCKIYPKHRCLLKFLFKKQHSNIFFKEVPHEWPRSSIM